MKYHVDPTYLKQVESAREAIYAVGPHLVKERTAFFSRKPHDLRRSLRPYNKCVAEHDVIMDAIIHEHWCDFYNKPKAWRHGAGGQAFEQWMQGLEDAKIGQIDLAAVRKKHLNIVCGPDDIDDVPAQLDSVQFL